MIVEPYRRGWRVYVPYAEGLGEDNEHHDLVIALACDLSPTRNRKEPEPPLKWIRNNVTANWHYNNGLAKRPKDRRKYLAIWFAAESDATLFKLAFQGFRYPASTRRRAVYMTFAVI